jgi:ribosomal protein L35
MNSAEQRWPLLKTGQGPSRRFSKVSSKVFGAKRPRNSHINIKYKEQFKRYKYLLDSLQNKPIKRYHF